MIMKDFITAKERTTFLKPITFRGTVINIVKKIVISTAIAVVGSAIAVA